MAAGITPSEAGIRLEPIEMVLDWARHNHIRQRFAEPEVEYEEFKESLRITEGR